VLWGRRELLEELPAYKLRPAPDSLPDRWMTGTQNHEGLAGVAAAIDYLAEIGSRHPAHRASFPELNGRRLSLHAGMAAIQEYEAGLANQMLDGLAERPRFKVWGVRDRHRLAWRVPTIAITMEDRTAEQLAQHLAARQIYVWNGNMYALGLTERLNLEHRGGFLRIGLMHYNTFEEIEQLFAALDAL
jgi:selenocysteine lyase/cysteine desulfurase